MGNLREFAKDIGQEDWFDALYGRPGEVFTPKDRSAKAEYRHRRKRKVKKKIARSSRQRNR